VPFRRALVRGVAQMPENPHYRTLAEEAARTSVSVKTLRRRIAEGQLTAYRFGPHLIRLDPAEVDALFRPIPTAGRVA
jgi:excisionase family DNA binding protein